MSERVRIAGKNAVVSGGALGIGRGIAEALSQRGSHMLIADYDHEAGRQTSAELGIDFVAVDLATTEGVRTMLAAARDRLRGLDILVNNVGGGARPAFPEAPSKTGITFSI